MCALSCRDAEIIGTTCGRSPSQDGGARGPTAQLNLAARHGPVHTWIQQKQDVDVVKDQVVLVQLGVKSTLSGRFCSSL